MPTTDGCAWYHDFCSSCRVIAWGGANLRRQLANGMTGRKEPRKNDVSGREYQVDLKVRQAKVQRTKTQSGNVFQEAMIKLASLKSGSEG